MESPTTINNQTRKFNKISLKDLKQKCVYLPTVVVLVVVVVVFCALEVMEVEFL